jgi:hypothetical protein
MRQIHDKGNRRLFKNKGISRQLLETFVAEVWVKEEENAGQGTEFAADCGSNRLVRSGDSSAQAGDGKLSGS